MIQTLAPLDREFAPFYWLTVLAVDRGSVALSAVTEVYIEVTDANDNPPRMSRPVFYTSILEGVPVGTSVLQLEAWDPDSSSKGKLTFNITGGDHMGFFSIHPFTGKGQASWVKHQNGGSQPESLASIGNWCASQLVRGLPGLTDSGFQEWGPAVFQQLIQYMLKFENTALKGHCHGLSAFFSWGPGKAKLVAW